MNPNEFTPISYSGTLNGRIFAEFRTRVRFPRNGRISAQFRTRERFR
ncbi:MAG: hypothetical protein Q8881_03215 [Sweet potato little leaf phytoplasma]|nr:hypothetical protein [Sweet potato little leaf phytoplasma]